MGWAVGRDTEHDRHRGYGVPAYCDAKGCETEIDRGLGYVCECIDVHIDVDQLDINIFVCGEHTCADVDEDNLPPEHPAWVQHVLTDDSWDQWRTEHPEKVAQFRATLDFKENE
jgi:hypothetical protein